MNEQRTRDQHGVAADHEQGEPQRNMRPQFGEGGPGEQDEAGEEEAFVGEGVEDRAKATDFLVFPGEVTVESIGRGDEDEDSRSDVPVGLDRSAGLEAGEVVDYESDKDGDAEDAEQGDPGRKGDGGGRRHEEGGWEGVRVES